MKPSLALVLAPLLLVAGCTDRGLDSGDTAPFDFAFAVHDFATQPPLDLSTSDFPINPACTQIAMWTSDQGVSAYNENPSSSQGYAWDDYVEGFATNSSGDGNDDILYYSFYEPTDMSQSSMVPHALDFTNPNESLALALDLPTDGSSGGTELIATSGDVTITAIDDTQPNGNVGVHGSNVTLQEIDQNGELMQGGLCVQIGSFDLEAMYPSPF